MLQAAQQGHSQIVNLLLEANASPNTTSNVSRIWSTVIIIIIEANTSPNTTSNVSGIWSTVIIVHHNHQSHVQCSLPISQWIGADWTDGPVDRAEARLHLRRWDSQGEEAAANIGIWWLGPMFQHRKGMQLKICLLAVLLSLCTSYLTTPPDWSFWPNQWR